MNPIDARRIEERAEELAQGWPEFSEDQIDRLSVLLRPYMPPEQSERAA